MYNKKKQSTKPGPHMIQPIRADIFRGEKNERCTVCIYTTFQKPQQRSSSEEGLHTRTKRGTKKNDRVGILLSSWRKGVSGSMRLALWVMIIKMASGSVHTHTRKQYKCTPHRLESLLCFSTMKPPTLHDGISLVVHQISEYYYNNSRKKKTLSQSMNDTGFS